MTNVKLYADGNAPKLNDIIRRIGRSELSDVQACEVQTLDNPYYYIVEEINENGTIVLDCISRLGYYPDCFELLARGKMGV